MKRDRERIEVLKVLKPALAKYGMNEKEIEKALFDFSILLQEFDYMETKRGRI